MNNHQRFTGINLPEGEAGTWKSLCGTESEDIRCIYREVVGVEPSDRLIGEAKWVMGGSVLYGESMKCRSLTEYRDWLTENHQALPPVENGNGLRHDWRKARSAWLYPGDETTWIASQRMMKWTPEKIHQYLTHPQVRDSTHIIICCNTGSRREIGEEPFDGLKNSNHVQAVFDQVIKHDMAPVAWCMSQEFFIQTLDRKHDRLLDYLEQTCQLVRDLCHFAIPFRELGEIYSGSAMPERNSMFKAMRRGGPSLPLAEHERGLTEVPVDDFRDVGGTIISGLQTSFSTPTGGNNRPQDQIMSPGGGHYYDGAAGFIQSNHDRMSRYASQGHILEDHVNAVFEHSLPLVYEGQQWKPTRTLSEAQDRGRVLLKHGAAFDLSSGVPA